MLVRFGWNAHNTRACLAQFVSGGMFDIDKAQLLKQTSTQ